MSSKEKPRLVRKEKNDVTDGVSNKTKRLARGQKKEKLREKRRRKEEREERR